MTDIRVRGIRRLELAVPPADATGCAICGRDACEDHLPPDRHSNRVRAELARQRIKREVRRLLDAEERGPMVEPGFRTLRERLALPLPETRWRITGWQPANSRVMFAAMAKNGKTTVLDNMLRSLVDGDDFLGRYAVSPLVGTVAVVDTEMSPTQLNDWLRVQAISRDEGVVVVPLRGQVASFDLLDAAVRARWVRWLRERRVEYLVLDCLRPVLDALGLDEHREAGRLLTAFDALLAEAGIADALVVQHMGHSNERSRGDSRMRDWPDVEWRLVRQNDDPSSPRFITAYGRDVDVPEARLDYDSVTRRLTLDGGSRADMKTDSALGAVLDVLADGAGPMTGRAIKQALDEGQHPRAAIEAALRQGVRTNVLSAENGPRNARLYRRSVPVSGSVPSVSQDAIQDAASECPASYIERDTRTLTPKAVMVPLTDAVHDSEE